MNPQRAIGEAITARSIAIDYYQGLGPPDLCCVTKQVRPHMRHCAILSVRHPVSVWSVREPVAVYTAAVECE